MPITGQSSGTGYLSCRSLKSTNTTNKSVRTTRLAGKVDGNTMIEIKKYYAHHRPVSKGQAHWVCHYDFNKQKFKLNSTKLFTHKHQQKYYLMEISEPKFTPIIDQTTHGRMGLSL